MKIINARKVELTRNEADIYQGFEAYLASGWSLERSIARLKELHPAADPALWRWMAGKDVIPEGDPQYVIVHIWDDNANVYGNEDAAIAGIATNHDEHETDAVREAVLQALASPGEAAYIDGGMSTVRYLSITTESE